VSKKHLSVVGLFAGIGGFELGLSRAGHDAILLCENDHAAQTVLKHRFPRLTISDDVTLLRSLPQETSIVCAGFPCQNLSSVGLKAGIRGSQSSLVGEVFRLLKRKRVKWVIFENVFFMLHLNKGAGIKYLTREMERLGYNWAYRVLDSAGFGVPQRRRRVFVVGAIDDDPRDVLLADDSRVPVELPARDVPIGFYWTEGTYATGLAMDSVPPLKGGSTIGIPSPPAILFPNGTVGTPVLGDAERLQGFPSAWTERAQVASRSRNVCWRLVGNAVTVPVVQWLGHRLLTPGVYDESGDVPLSEDETWPNAGWCVGGDRFASQASERPGNIRHNGLTRFLNFPTKPLSRKAAVGFLDRARRGSLRYPDGFLAAIDSYAKSVVS
jgi:DNA (cytosine-5)-methyltransferase 1